MTPDELRRRQDLAVEAAAGRELRPTPGGAAGRAAAEHHAAAGLRARPDADRYADEILGHEMAARALTDAALCEREDDDGVGSAPNPFARPVPLQAQQSARKSHWCK